MKILFLDIDGVLNCSKTVERHHGVFGLDSSLVNIFHDMITEMDINIVLSSSWRHDKDWYNTLAAQGLDMTKFIGRTPYNKKDTCRGDDIAAWLDSHCRIDKYAILDDDSDMLPDQPLFQTSWETGLTQEIANNIKQYLK